MAANLPKPSTDENISTTLASGITDVATSMDVSDASKIPYPTYLVLDRVDSAGTLKTSTLWEYVKVTNVAGNTLTITRGQSGSTNQSHGSGAVVEAVVTSAMFEDWYAVLNPEHDSAGGHVISTATITNAVITSAIIANASITGNLNVGNSLLVSAASVVGLGLNPTWYLGTLPSLPSVGLGRPLSMPRVGTWKWASVTLNANISQPTVFFDVNKNFTSIFDTIGRPLIAGGTFVSTASIKTPNFSAGDIFNVDYEVIDLGGRTVDATVQLGGI
jgi:hypothetical protein